MLELHRQPVWTLQQLEDATLVAPCRRQGEAKCATWTKCLLLNQQVPHSLARIHWISERIIPWKPRAELQHLQVSLLAHGRLSSNQIRLRESTLVQQGEEVSAVLYHLEGTQVWYLLCIDEVLRIRHCSKLLCTSHSLRSLLLARSCLRASWLLLGKRLMTDVERLDHLPNLWNNLWMVVHSQHTVSPHNLPLLLSAFLPQLLSSFHFLLLGQAHDFLQLLP
mmetsp:Transcript_35611/g.83272  ORF Transcript_35611/g.83272 Transcript_35611/m.83272 type:complete len:222 (-) Transcript_35611:39-704(-)